VRAEKTYFGPDNNKVFTDQETVAKTLNTWDHDGEEEGPRDNETASNRNTLIQH